MLVKLTETAERLGEQSGISYMPFRANPDDAGMDLRLCKEGGFTLYPGEQVKLSSGVHIFIEDQDVPPLMQGHGTLALLLMPRSSCSGWQLQNTVGLIDRGYTNEIFFKIQNLTDDHIEFEEGERIVQAVIIPVLTPIANQIPSNIPFPQTSRGNNGNGSSGKI